LKSQFRKKRNSKSPGHKRGVELDMKKGEVAVSMLRRAVKNGFIASYVLMDSWFVNDYMIKSIRSIKKGAMHLLGMCKIDRRKYLVGNREMNAHQLIVKNQRKNSKYSRKHKSTYISMVVDYKGVKVRLFFIRYNNAKQWTLLLTTDLTLSDVEEIMEKLMQSDKTSKQLLAMLRALEKFEDNDQNNNTNVDCQAVA
jgi:L-rhamnose mutarotase